MPQAKRNETEGFFRNLFNNSPIGICISASRKFLYTNRQFQQLSGYSEDELLGMDALSLVHPEDRNMVTQNAVKMLKGEHSSPCEYRVVTNGGGIRWVMGAVSSIKYQGRRAVLEHYMDIAEYRQMKQALSETEEFSFSLLNNSVDPIIVINPDTSTRSVNPALLKLTGFSRREVAGRKAPYPWWPAEKHKEYSKTLQKTMLKGTKRLEMIFQKKTGEQFWVDITSTPKTRNGKLCYYLGYWVDITERKQAEARLIQSAKLSSLAVMAGGTAHELRNPLGIISATAQLLLEQRDCDQLRIQCAKKIVAATKRASLIIENLLRFAHPADQQMTEVNVQAILKEAVALLRDQMTMHKVTLRTELQPHLPRIHSNPDLLEQVFINLMLNALNAMPHGGTLTVATRLVPGGKMEMRFSDTGVGILPEHLPKIFDPFFTTQLGGKDIGLGLAISYSIVQQQHGTIEVATQVGIGTTVTVRLPCGHCEDRLPTLTEGQTADNLLQTR